MSTLTQWFLQKKIFRSVSCTLLLYLLLALSRLILPIDSLEYTALNWAYTQREQVEVNDDICFWNIDDSDIEQLRWPWAWDRFAWIVKTMDRYGAKLGVIEPEVFSIAGHPTLSESEKERKMEELWELLDDETALGVRLSEMETSPAKPLVEAMKAWPHVILGQNFVIPDAKHQEPQALSTLSQRQRRSFLPAKLHRIEQLDNYNFSSESISKNLIGAVNLSPLSLDLQPHVKGLGFTRVWPDLDGVIRRYPTLLNYNDQMFPSLAVMVAAAHYGLSFNDLDIQSGQITFPNVPSPRGDGDLSIPIEDNGLMYVNWSAKKQIEEYEFSPFAPIKTLINIDMAKEIAWSFTFDEGALGRQWKQLQSHLTTKLNAFGWVSPSDQRHIEVMLWWLIQNLLTEGNELEDILGYTGSFSSKVDLDLFYQSLLLNTISVLRYDESNGMELSYEQAISNDIATIQSNGMLLDFLNEQFLSDTPDLLEQLVESGLIVQDEDFSHEDIERVLFLKLDHKKNEWLTCVAENSSLGTDEQQALFSLYQYLQNKERLLRNGYRQTLFHCKRGNIDECYPLYFPLPQKLSLGSRERDISLTDIENKVVFVGLSGTGLNALNPTPYTVRHTMASLNATAFNTITTAGFLQKFQWFEPYLILGYGFVVFIAVFFWPAWLALIIGVAMACAHVFLTAQLLETSGWIVAIVTPVISILGAYLIANLLLYIEQQRERKKIRAMFSSMVSQEVLKIMEDEPERFNLQGDKVEASMFSSDVSGFTSISEGVTAQELALILNLYLTPMSNLVMTYGGYVEKYEGDAIKADFGVPLPDEDHAWKACFSALLQQEELTVVQRMLQIKYGVVISARMGVNTGVVNAGMMGSDQKMQYCALGEEVAMAEELEPANKMWESWIAISPETLRLTGDRLETRLLDTVRFPHVTIPVYELLGWKKSAFLAFWAGKAIPKLVIEGWERINPEKLLAYLDYYRENSFEQHAFYKLMLEAFSSQEQNAMTYVEVNDRIELSDMEQRFHDLTEQIRCLGANISLDDLDPVDRTEMDELLAAEGTAAEPWRKKIASHLVELKWSGHCVDALSQSLDQDQRDELNTAIDTLEKNCHCILKRTRFPTENDVYGNRFKIHLTSMLNDDALKIGAEELKDLRKQRAKRLAELKQAMVRFIKQAKPLAASYHEMMADHCVMDDRQRSVCESYAKGHELYLAQQWDEASLHFQQGIDALPSDGPCFTLLKRCENFKKNPPQKDWDGTWLADW